jgi:hypothetical protein
MSGSSTSSPFADRALPVAARGIPVFAANPAPTTEEGGKKPYTANGFKDATTDPDQIREWGTKWPDALIAMPTGAVSGLWVIDVDVDEEKGIDGEASLMELLEREGPLPATAVAITPRGGRHFYFRYPKDGTEIKNSTSKLGKGIDVRGDGGYVILPPSVRLDGKAYRWHDRTKAAPAPDHLLQLVTKQQPKVNGHDRAPPRTPNGASDAASHYVEGAFARIIGELSSAHSGRRNHSLNDAAFALGQFVGAGVLERQRCEAALRGVALSLGLTPEEIERTLRSGLEAGIAEPRDLSDIGQRSNGRGAGSAASASTVTDDAPPPAVREFPTLDEAALIGLPGEIVRLIEPHTEGDPVAILLNLHAFFGNAIGRAPHYRVERTDHCPNLYVLQIGESSKARKGTAADQIKSLFRIADEMWATRRYHSGLSSGEGVIWEVRDQITKMVKDGKGSDAPMVEEVVDPGISDKRLFVMESEFAGALRVMQREGNTLSRVLRDGWDRGDLATMVKNSPARATGAHISIVGHITSSELRVCLDKTEMANGFANRFLMACVRRSKLLPHGGDHDETALRDMGLCVADAITRARGLRRVTMTLEARATWEDIYAELSEARPGLLGALTARAEAQVIRLALIYALWDGTDRITVDHLTAAVAVWEYCAASVEYVFGDALGDPVADAILVALRGAGSDGLTRTDISNLFSRNASAAQVARALGELSRHGLAEMRKREPSGGGRPAETWALSRRRG